MFQLKRSLPVAALLLAVGSYVGLISATPPAGGLQNDQNAEATYLQNGQRTWQQYAIQNYKYQLGKECDVCCYTNVCMNDKYPWTVQVNSDWTAAKAYDSQNGPAYTANTVEQAFAEIQAALTNTNQLVSAIYDPTYGFPSRYDIQTGPGNDISHFDTTVMTQFAQLTAPQSTLYTNGRNLWAGQRRTTYTYTYYDMLAPTTYQAQGYQWPFTVRVNNNVVTQVSDSRGVVLTMSPTPSTIDQYFDEISRQLSVNAPYIENYYDPTRGYPTKMFMLGASGTGNTDIQITAIAY